MLATICTCLAWKIVGIVMAIRNNVTSFFAPSTYSLLVVSPALVVLGCGIVAVVVVVAIVMIGVVGVVGFVVSAMCPLTRLAGSVPWHGENIRLGALVMVMESVNRGDLVECKFCPAENGEAKVQA